MPHNRYASRNRTVVRTHLNEALESLAEQSWWGMFQSAEQRRNATIERIVGEFFWDHTPQERDGLIEGLKNGNYRAIRKVLVRAGKLIDINKTVPVIEPHRGYAGAEIWQPRERTYAEMEGSQKLWWLLGNALAIASSLPKLGAIAGANNGTSKASFPAIEASQTQSAPAQEAQATSSFGNAVGNFAARIGDMASALWERTPTFLPTGASAETATFLPTGASAETVDQHDRTIGAIIKKTSVELGRIYEEIMSKCNDEEKERVKLLLEKSYRTQYDPASVGKAKDIVWQISHPMFKEIGLLPTDGGLDPNLRAFQMGASLLSEGPRIKTPRTLFRHAIDFLDYAIKNGIKQAAVVRAYHLGHNQDYLSRVTVGEFNRSHFADVVKAFGGVNSDYLFGLATFVVDVSFHLMRSTPADPAQAIKYHEEVKKWRDALITLRGVVPATDGTGLKDYVIDNTKDIDKYLAPTKTTGKTTPPTHKKEVTPEQKVEQILQSKKEAEYNQELILASYHGDIEKVNQLLHKGANPNFADKEQGNGAALHSAAQNGHVEIVDRLLKAKADPNQKMKGGVTALHHAAQKGHLNVVNRLLAAVETPDQRAEEDFTPLMAASQSGHKKVVIALLEKGADPDAERKDGGTSLGFAAGKKSLTKGTQAKNYLEIVNILLNAGADPNRVEPGSVFHLAVQAEDLETVKALLPYVDLDLKIDQKPKTQRQYTALEVAQTKKLKAETELLQEAYTSIPLLNQSVSLFEEHGRKWSDKRRRAHASNIQKRVEHIQKNVKLSTKEQQTLEDILSRSARAITVNSKKEVTPEQRVEQILRDVADPKLKELYKEVFRASPTRAENTWQKIMAMGLTTGMQKIPEATQRQINVTEKNKEHIFAYLFAETITYEIMEEKKNPKLFASVIKITEHAGIQTKLNFMFATRFDRLMMAQVAFPDEKLFFITPSSYEDLYIDAVIQAFPELTKTKKNNLLMAIKTVSEMSLRKDTLTSKDLRSYLRWYKAPSTIKPHLTEEQKRNVDWPQLEKRTKELETIIARKEADEKERQERRRPRSTEEARAAFPEKEPTPQCVVPQPTEELCTRDGAELYPVKEKPKPQPTAEEAPKEARTHANENNKILGAAVIVTAVIGVYASILVAKKSAQLKDLEKQKKALEEKNAAQLQAIARENKALVEENATLAKVIERHEAKMQESDRLRHRLEGQLKEITREKEINAQALERIRAELASASQRLDTQSQTIKKLREELTQARAQQAQKEIAAREREIQELKKDLAARQESYDQLVRQYMECRRIIRMHEGNVSVIADYMFAEVKSRVLLAREGRPLPNELGEKWKDLNIPPKEEQRIIHIANMLAASKVRGNTALLHHFAYVAGEEGVGQDEYEKEKTTLLQAKSEELGVLNRIIRELQDVKDVAALSSIYMEIRSNQTMTGFIVAGIHSVAGAALIAKKPEAAASSAAAADLRAEQALADELNRTTGLQCDARDVVRTVCRMLVGELQCLRSSLEAVQTEQRIEREEESAAAGETPGGPSAAAAASAAAADAGRHARRAERGGGRGGASAGMKH